MKTACLTSRRFFILLLLLISFPQPSLSDTVTVRGTTLEGHVVSVHAEYIRFETIYGKGAIEIQFVDIERMETNNPYIISLLDGKKIKGLVFGSERTLKVGTNLGTATHIPMDSIQSGTMAGAQYDPKKTSPERAPPSGGSARSTRRSTTASRRSG